MYKRAADQTQFLSRTASHATKGSRRGFMRDDFVALEREKIEAERQVILELRRVARKKTTELYAMGGQHEKTDKFGTFNRRLKKAGKALLDYSFLISEYVDQHPGDNRTIEHFEKARAFARKIRVELDALKLMIDSI
jgi:hypothetical protein